MTLRELEIKRNNGKPVGEQIASFLRSKIYKRAFKAGERLPTTQEIVKQTGVGSNTVRQAIQLLKEEGLVRPVPRLGTIVNELKTDMKSERGVSSQKDQLVIAVTDLLTPTNDTLLYRPETAEGITRECERLGAIMVTLPSSVSRLGPEALADKLSALGCKGLICGSLPDAHLDCLSANGVTAITLRRFRCNDGMACVECDYDGSGYEVGLYYYSLGLSKVTVFSHYEMSCGEGEAKRNGYTLGLKHGIGRAYESKGVDLDIDFIVNKSFGDLETSKRILSRLGSVALNTCIVFTNAYQLQRLFRDFPDEAQKRLSDKKVTVIANKTNLVALERYVGGIDLMILLDHFEKVGSMQVSMLAGMIEGYLPKHSTALSKIEYLPFSEALKI